MNILTITVSPFFGHKRPRDICSSELCPHWLFTTRSFECSQQTVSSENKSTYSFHNVTISPSLAQNVNFVRWLVLFPESFLIGGLIWILSQNYLPMIGCFQLLRSNEAVGVASWRCHVRRFLHKFNWCWFDLRGVKYCNGLSKYWVSRSFELRECVCSRIISWVTDTSPAFPAVEIRECLPANLSDSSFDVHILLKNLEPKQMHPTFSLDGWSKSEFDLRTDNYKVFSLHSPHTYQRQQYYLGRCCTVMRANCCTKMRSNNDVGSHCCAIIFLGHSCVTMIRGHCYVCFSNGTSVPIVAQQWPLIMRVAYVLGKTRQTGRHWLAINVFIAHDRAWKTPKNSLSLFLGVKWINIDDDCS
jgi:hypothetical protein